MTHMKDKPMDFSGLQNYKIKKATWLGALSAKAKLNIHFCKCDFCHKQVIAESCKVYHTIDKCPRFTKFLTDKKYLLTDHVYVCYACLSVLDLKTWTGCKCKKSLVLRDEEDVCLIN